MDKLELLDLGKDFYVTKQEGEYYHIEFKGSNLGATISNEKKITYYITNCFDSGVSWISFDINKLEKLKRVCEVFRRRKRKMFNVL